MSLINTGYVKIDLKIYKSGAMTKEESGKVRREIVKAIEKHNLEMKGEVSFIEIETIEFK